METLDGETRRAPRRPPPGGLDAEDVAWLGLHLASALHYLHGRGVLHLDVKPSNVVAEAGRAKLIDLSLARPPGRYQRRRRHLVQPLARAGARRRARARGRRLGPRHGALRGGDGRAGVRRTTSPERTSTVGHGRAARRRLPAAARPAPPATAARWPRRSTPASPPTRRSGPTLAELAARAGAARAGGAAMGRERPRCAADRRGGAGARRCCGRTRAVVRRSACAARGRPARRPDAGRRAPGDRRRARGRARAGSSTSAATATTASGRSRSARTGATTRSSSRPRDLALLRVDYD